VANEVSEVTRRTIIDYLVTSDTRYSGRLDEDDFLSRLYDLSKLPSTDSRMRTALGDIRQHRINWQDWEDDWVFYDSRFNLFRASDDEFLRFLCETLHPVVREADAVRTLVDAYNAELRADGWQLVEAKQMSGKPIFNAKRIKGRAEISSEPTGWPKVDSQIQEMRMRLDAADAEEHYQAIGLYCREVLISLAQAVFDPLRHKSVDGVAPSDTDAARMLEAVFAAELGGSANEEARAHAKAALKLALALQHKRTADRRLAALCAEGTFSVVNMTAVLTGRR
jgi:hypothetical protein